MAITAINAENADVMFMAKGYLLDAVDAFAGPIGGAAVDEAGPQHETGEQRRPEHANAGKGIGAAREDLRHDIPCPDRLLFSKASYGGVVAKQLPHRRKATLSGRRWQSIVKQGLRQGG